MKYTHVYTYYSTRMAKVCVRERFASWISKPFSVMSSKPSQFGDSFDEIRMEINSSRNWDKRHQILFELCEEEWINNKATHVPLLQVKVLYSRNVYLCV